MDLTPEEHLIEYNKKVVEINKLTEEELDDLIKHDRCPYPSEHLIHSPLGMHHCPLCGTMVVAGFHHGPKDW